MVVMAMMMMTSSSSSPKDIQSMVKEVTPDVSIWRQHIHRNPDLSREEGPTAEYIALQLEMFGCPQLTVTRPIPNAVIAILRGGGGGGNSSSSSSSNGPTIALRADIDALPLDEDTTEPFKSSKRGVMHASGHDGHAAMLMGACKVLCAIHASIRGSVKFIFQHSQERPPSGAKELIQLSVLDGVSTIFALHVTPQLPVGYVGVKPGGTTVGSDLFDIVIKGRGGRGTNQELLIDPVPIAAEVVLGLQTIVSRKVNHQHAPVLTISTMTTGPDESHSIVPETVTLRGGVHCHDAEVLQVVPKLMERVVKGITEAHGANYTFHLQHANGVVNNDVNSTKLAEQVARDIVGEKRVYVPTDPMLRGDDFCRYQQIVPGCLIALGVGNKPNGISEPLQTARFRLDENGLPIGVAIHVGLIHAMLIL